MSDQKYLAGDAVYRYPEAGDEPAPVNTKLLLLTTGGVCVIGSWRDDDCIAWAPMPKRDRAKEQFMAQAEIN